VITPKRSSRREQRGWTINKSGGICVFKKLIVLFLSVILCLGLSACGEKTRGELAEPLPNGKIAEELDPDSVVTVIDRKTIPDMGLFFGRGRAHDEAEEGSTAGYQDVEMISEEDAVILLEYFRLLQDEFGFELVDSYHIDWEQGNPFGDNLMGGYWSAAFVATRMDAGKELEDFGNDTPCDLYVYGSKGDATLCYSSLFNIADTGHRHSGYEGDEVNALYGQRALEAYQSKGGYYYNKGDKKLKVEASVREPDDWDEYDSYTGSAAVIRNGMDTRTGTAFIGRNSGAHHYYFRVENITGGAEGEKILLRLPADVVSEGAVFRLCDFLSGHQKEEEKECYVLYYVPSYADDEIYANFSTSLRGCVEACTVRVLHWDPSGIEDCVIYISMKMVHDADPVEVECLISAPVNDQDLMEKELLKKEEEQKKSSSSLWSGSSNSTYSPNVAEFAKLDCLTCGGDGDCNTCGGYGEVERYAGAGDTVTSKCSSCYGSGNCRTCGGSGKRD